MRTCSQAPLFAHPGSTTQTAFFLSWQPPPTAPTDATPVVTTFQIGPRQGSGFVTPWCNMLVMTVRHTPLNRPPMLTGSQHKRTQVELREAQSCVIQGFPWNGELGMRNRKRRFQVWGSLVLMTHYTSCQAKHWTTADVALIPATETFHSRSCQRDRTWYLPIISYVWLDNNFSVARRVTCECICLDHRGNHHRQVGSASIDWWKPDWSR